MLLNGTYAKLSMRLDDLLGQTLCYSCSLTYSIRIKKRGTHRSRRCFQ